MQSTKGRSGRLLMGAGILATAFTLRPIFSSLSVRLPEVVREMGLSAWQASLLTTLPVLCLGVFAPAAGRLAQRWGYERTIFLALVVIAVGTALRALGTVWALFLFSILAGMGVATANVLLPSLVKRDFADRSALLTGMYVMGISGGAALAAAITVPIEHALGGGWRLGLALWMIPALVAVVIWAPLLRDHQARPRETIQPVRGLWRSLLAWRVSVFMGLQSALAFSVMSWLAPILRERGLDPVYAGMVVSGLIIVQLATCLTVPTLANRLRDQRALAMTLTAGGVVGLLGLLFAPLETVWAWALMQGLAQGGLFALALTMVLMRSPDSNVAAHLSGMAQGVGYIPAAFAPLFIGLLHSWTGDFVGVGVLFGLIGMGLAWSGLGAARPVLLELDAAPLRVSPAPT